MSDELTIEILKEAADQMLSQDAYTPGEIYMTNEQCENLRRIIGQPIKKYPCGAEAYTEEEQEEFDLRASSKLYKTLYGDK